MIINIMGIDYEIQYKNIDEDKKSEDLEAYTDFYHKKIVVFNIEQRDAFKDDIPERIIIIKKKLLRHEIIHAYLFESGLDCNSNRAYSWADNEEMVDWIAIQSSKIFKTFKDLDLLEEI